MCVCLCIGRRDGGSKRDTRISLLRNFVRYVCHERPAAAELRPEPERQSGRAAKHQALTDCFTFSLVPESDARSHNPSIAFRHLPPDSAGVGYATEGLSASSPRSCPPTRSAPSEKFGRY